MEDSGNYGVLNGHGVGIILRELVRRATVAIRKERMVFEATVKEGYGGSMDDVFTSADTKAQLRYLRSFGECLGLCGVLGEENNLRIPCPTDRKLYLTVDPLDGTKAYVRRQSHGIATMVALVDGDEVVSAYIGDINTEEIYGYRPGSKRVHRITRYESAEELSGHDLPDPFTGYALLRDPLNKYSALSQKTVGRFKNYEIIGSSIGTWTARFWKREVSALLIPPGWETPWDSTPVDGITKKLGYAHLRPALAGEYWEQFEPALLTEKQERMHDVLIIHSSHAYRFARS